MQEFGLPAEESAVSRPTSQELLRQYQAGDDQAAAAIFDRYVERLIALARSRIGAKLQRRLDPEDVVQSAYRSFFAHARDEEFLIARSGDLWRLLAGITLNKLHGQIEKQTAARRSIAREEPASMSDDGLEAPQPSAAEVVAVVEQLHLVVGSLSPAEQAVLTSSLYGHGIEEIGKSLGKSERTVRRLLAEVRRNLEQRLAVDRDQPGSDTRSVLLQPEPQAPLRFSDYVLEQMIGAGGMGKVFRAKDKQSGETVAVKALHKSRQSDPRAVAQFVQEAQVLARLRHPGIVGVTGLGQFPSGGFFIVMEYVEGIDLQTRLAKEPLPLNEVCSIALQVAAAIGHAHDNGIVHCDLKPGNVLIASNGRAVVTDFGFARIVTGLPPSAARSIGGTAGYMAPEVLRLHSPPTPAADIYALGALMWALAIGTVPQRAASLHFPDPALDGLKAICLRCLAEEPDERYASVHDLHQALLAISDQPENSTPSG